MAKHDMFGRLAQQVGERLQDVSRGPEEVQRTVQSAMRSAFDRMELVSREDFDVMMEVLQRTRSRVEALEKQVARLEAALDERDGKATTTAAAESMQGENDTPAEGSSIRTDTGTAPSGTATDRNTDKGNVASGSAGKTTRGSGKRASGSNDQSGQGTAD